MKIARTLIIGAYGYGNMGDEAILQGILREISDKRNVDVVSATPIETESLHRVKAVLRNNIDYTKYSTVILGGGGYYPGSYEIPMKICLELKKRGAGLIIKAIGFTSEIAGKDNFDTTGPGVKERAILSDLVEKADYFSVRTHKDLERVKRYTHTNKEIKVEVCSAYNISFSKKEGEEILNKFGFSTKDKLCGISVAKFGYRKGLKDFLENYKKDFILVPVPMCRHYYATFENDILLLHEYFKKLNLLSRDVIRFMKYLFTPSEMKGVLSNLTFLVTTRKHAMVLGLGGGLRPEQIILLGTHESGMAEYFNVREIDWRQWPRSANGLKFSLARYNFEIKTKVRLFRKYITL